MTFTLHRYRRSSVTSAYGAAGSLVVVLLWVYFSAQILLFGAQFTQIYSNRYGSHIEPVPGAEVVTPKELTVQQRRPAGRKANEPLMTPRRL